MSIIIFIISLAVLILVHECGHFLVAKWAGIRVDEFGLGFPPKIWSKKVGETTYTLNLIPFGGFVKIFGEDPHKEDILEKDRYRSMYYKPKWVQALVLFAGVAFNIIFAWLLISFSFMFKLPPHLALLQGLQTTYFLIENTTVGLGHFLWNIITLKADFSQVSGPVGIAKVVEQAQSLGFRYLMSLIALISVNLAVLNLVPFPALDGGRLLFILVEVIIGRPISSSFVRWANAIGFLLLIVLMIFVTSHDILRLYK